MTQKEKVELIRRKNCKCDICGRYVEEPVDQGNEWGGKNPPRYRRFMDVVKGKVVCSDCVPDIVPVTKKKPRKFKDPNQMRIV